MGSDAFGEKGQVNICGTVYSKALKQKVKVVVLFSKDKSKHKIFFSNAITLSGHSIVETYRCRFL
ncbi:MAG: hypothetical protein K5764_03635 [Prevotella sp.]|nr:hypothetical protein [Prevotella sp.]